jgi:hypothetical protein
MSLLTNCEKTIIDGCLVFNNISVSDQDKKALSKSSVSDQFLRDLVNYKETRKEVCP